MLYCPDSLSACFYPDKLDVSIVHKRVENPDGVAASAHTGDDVIGQATALGQNLLSGFLAYDRLKITHH